MAGGGYKRPLFNSRALRPGGEGTVKPKEPGSMKLGGGLPKIGETIKPMTKLPALAKGGSLGPKLPKMPKIPGIKPVKF
jgi:hypothetical protein